MKDDKSLSYCSGNGNKEQRIKLRALKEIEWLGLSDGISQEDYRHPHNLWGFRQQRCVSRPYCMPCSGGGGTGGLMAVPLGSRLRTTSNVAVDVP